MFTEKFDTFVCMGDTISTEVDGFTITARIEYDQDYRIDDDDSHNIDQSVTGCDDEQQAELIAARNAWYNDEWWYGGVVLSVSKAGVVLTDHAASLWGIDINHPCGNNDYLTEVANELLAEAVEQGHAVMERLMKVS